MDTKIFMDSPVPVGFGSKHKKVQVQEPSDKSDLIPSVHMEKSTKQG